jgi:MFS family permease
MESNDAQPVPAAPKRLPLNVLILGMASLWNDIASEMIFPLLPRFLKSVLGVDKFELGAIEGVADSLASVLKLWSGGWSDRSGRRKGFVVVGYTLAALARPIIGLSTTFGQVFAARLGDRFGKGLRTSARDAMIADSTDPTIRGRAFGFHRAMDHLGAAVGPLLAAGFLWLWPDKLRLLFVLTIIPGLLVIFLIAFFLREPPRKEAHAQPLQLTLQPFDRNFRRFLLSLVLFTLGNSSDAFLLVRAEELGVAIVLLPVLWSVFHVAKSAGNLLGGRAVDLVGPRPLILAGWIIYAAVYLLFAFATAAWQVWLLFMAYAIFYALTEPSEKTFVAQLVGSERKGLAYGWYNFAMGISTLPASLIFGALYQEFGALVAFGWGAALALIAAILLLGVRPANPNPANSPG